MTAIICRMLNVKDEADKAKGKTFFDDVADDHWAAGYINVATEKGIIKGGGNGKFRPEDEVKYEEALKMVVCAIGYGDDAVKVGGWPDGYIAVAGDKGLTKNLRGLKGNASLRSDVALMVYNGLVFDLVPPVASIAEGTYTSAKKITLSSTTKGAEIYYTTDGKESTVKSTEYKNPIDIKNTTTIMLLRSP